MSETSHAETQPGSEAVGHEVSDVHMGPLVKFGAGLTVFAALVLVAIWGLFQYLEGREAQLKQSAFPLAAGERGKLPPEPRLEGINLQYGINRSRPESAQKPEMDESDREAVKKAMMMLEDKLPVRPQPEGRNRGLQFPSDSNSGRGTPGERQ